MMTIRAMPLCCLAVLLACAGAGSHAADAADDSTFEIVDTVADELLTEGVAASCQEHADCDEGERCLSGECRSSPPPCGQPANPACHGGLGQEDCADSGGHYHCGPDYFGETTCFCYCASGDEGCPCWGPRHCHGYCEAEGDPAGTAECQAARMGTCSQYAIDVPLGCHCIISRYPDPYETFHVVCAD